MNQLNSLKTLIITLAKILTYFKNCKASQTIYIEHFNTNTHRFDRFIKHTQYFNTSLPKKIPTATISI